MSLYLYTRLSPATAELLDDFTGSGPPTASLLGELIGELNDVLAHDTHLQQQEFVDSLDLPDGVRKLIREQSERFSTLLRINRTILESAYPSEIAQIHKNALEVVTQPKEGFIGSAQTKLTALLSDHDGVILYKIHGSFMDEEPDAGFPPVVITEEDYIELLTILARKDGSIPNMITGMMASCNLLFLGYGLEDWDFRTLHKGFISNVPANKQRESFAIQHDPPEYWVRFWENNNVVIYNMDIYEFADELEQRCKIYRLAS
jgi:SIR2-like domain